MKKKKFSLLLAAAAVLAAAPMLMGANTVKSAALSAELSAGASTDASEPVSTDAPEPASTDVPIRRIPSGMAEASDGTVLVTDLYNKVIWKRSGDAWTVYAGSSAARDADGSAAGGYFDGGKDEALFQTPWGIAPFLNGYAVSDTKNHVIRLIRDEKVSTAAGRRDAGNKNGKGTAAQFDSPTGIAAAENGDLFIADTGSHAIRRLSTRGQVTTVAGGTAGCADGGAEAARLREPTGLFYADGVLYIADSGNHRICKWADNQLTTLAGALPDPTVSAAEQGGFLDGPVEEARFQNPQGVILGADGALYVADTGNGAVRKIADGQVTTVYDRTVSGTAVYPVSPRGMLLQGGITAISDVFAGTVYYLPGGVS